MDCLQHPEKFVRKIQLCGGHEYLLVYADDSACLVRNPADKQMPADTFRICNLTEMFFALRKLKLSDLEPLTDKIFSDPDGLLNRADGTQQTNNKQNKNESNKTNE